MKLHYFEQDAADQDDGLLKMAIGQGYVPETCLLGGMVVMQCINTGKNPCRGCTCQRNKCHGRSF